MSGQAAAQDASIARSMQPFSRADDATVASVDATQFITFVIGDDHYGIDIMAVREIKDWTAIRHLPHQPDYVRGICSLRGAFIPIIDLRCRFGQGLTAATVMHVVIIVQMEQQLVGLLADRVSDIISVDPAKIKPVPKVAQTARLDFLSGIVTIDEALIALIELPNLLTQPEIKVEEAAVVH